MPNNVASNENGPTVPASFAVNMCKVERRGRQIAGGVRVLAPNSRTERVFIQKAARLQNGAFGNEGFSVVPCGLVDFV